MPKRTYAVLGTGAVGGFYGAKLQKAGFDVHFLLRSDYDWVRSHGLEVKSPQGDFHLPQVLAYQTSEQMPLCDVVIVALKTTKNGLLSQILPPLLKPGSTVVVLQNGLGNESAIAKSLSAVHQGALTLVGGLCFLCSNKLQPGVIQHLDYGLINLGQYGVGDMPMGITPTLKQLAVDFEQAGIDVKLSENLLLERWKKLIWNIPFNGLSVVLDAKTSELINDDRIVALVHALMREITQAASAYQCDIPDSFLDYMLNLTAKMHPYRTSMKLDFDAKRVMEVETMFGNPLQAAQRMNVATPKLEMLYQQLRFLNGRIGENAALPTHHAS